jgi:glycogen operon protein
MLLSQGTPMALMGDERGRSQGGNNNAYCQEGPINWLDWESRVDPFEAFCRGLAQIRASRPLLTYNRFLHSHDDNPEHRSVAWLRPAGAPMEPHDWEDPERRAVVLVMQGAADRPLLLAANAGADARRLKLPHGRWVRLVDTGRGLADQDATAAPETGEVALEGRTLLLFEGADVFRPFEPDDG